MAQSAVIRAKLDAGTTTAVSVHNPAYQAYQILHIGFVVAPIVAGIDKFFHYLVDWNGYLAPVVAKMVPASIFMNIVGVVEIVAGLLVAVKPRVGGYVVGVWLLAIVGNFLIFPGFYDIALRDFGLALGAFALARLAEIFDVGGARKTINP
jgi:hypothetical protein